MLSHSRYVFLIPAKTKPRHQCLTLFLSDTTKDITADRERTNKRVHAHSKSSHESKRVKHNDVTTTNNNNNSNLSSLENILSASVQSSQLLQQLVSQQVPKNRNWPDQLSTQESQRNRSNNANANSLYEESNLCRLNDEGGGLSNPRKNVFENDGGGRPTSQRQHQQQSNSVLMNLLVSGCDVSAGYVCLTKQTPRSSKGIASK